jgi:hypothetical protein
MDPVYPRTTLFLRSGAITVFALAMINLFFNRYPNHIGEKLSFTSWVTGSGVWADASWSSQEWLIFASFLLIVIISAWTGRNHPELSVENISASARYTELEDMDTTVGVVEQGFVNPQTAAIVASIVGQEEEQQQTVVDSALSNLGQVDVGEIIKAPEIRQAAEKLEQTTIPITEQAPLKERDFVSDGVDHIPLPGTDPLELPPLPNIPELPDLDDIIDEPVVNTPTPPPLNLPELPDFD